MALSIIFMPMKLVFGYVLVFNLLFGQVHGQASSPENDKVEVLIRMIGHQLLLQSEDSLSLVLPIKKNAENHYTLRFEKPLFIPPDSLVSLTQFYLGTNQAYIVNVKDCLLGEIVYSYAVSHTQREDIIPCIGRQLPKNCYRIEIEFLNKDKESIQAINYYYLAGGLTFILILVSIFLAKHKQSNTSKVFKIGRFVFDSEKQFLLLQQEKVELTNKENKLLHIFVSSPNEIVERDRLQKEVWEDEGVIVGRSLDMFISKLRKKLHLDPNVKLNNIHGKGYKLEFK